MLNGFETDAELVSVIVKSQKRLAETDVFQEREQLKQLIATAQAKLKELRNLR